MIPIKKSWLITFRLRYMGKKDAAQQPDIPVSVVYLTYPRSNSSSNLIMATAFHARPDGTVTTTSTLMP